MKRGSEFVGCTVLPMGLAICAFWAIVFAWLPAGHMSGGRFPMTVFGTLIGTLLAAFGTLAAPKWGREGLLVERGNLVNAASRRWTMLAKTGFAAIFALVFQVGFVWVVWREFR